MTAEQHYQLTAKMLLVKIDEYVAKGLSIIEIVRTSDFKDPDMTGNSKANYIIIAKDD